MQAKNKTKTNSKLNARNTTTKSAIKLNKSPNRQNLNIQVTRERQVWDCAAKVQTFPWFCQLTTRATRGANRSPALPRLTLCSALWGAWRAKHCGCTAQSASDPPESFAKLQWCGHTRSSSTLCRMLPVCLDRGSPRSLPVGSREHALVCCLEHGVSELVIGF